MTNVSTLEVWSGWNIEEIIYILLHLTFMQHFHLCSTFTRKGKFKGTICVLKKEEQDSDEIVEKCKWLSTVLESSTNHKQHHCTIQSTRPSSLNEPEGECDSVLFIWLQKQQFLQTPPNICAVHNATYSTGSRAVCMPQLYLWTRALELHWSKV